MTVAGCDEGTLQAGVYHGDAVDFARRLLPRSVDLVITSPPYWGLRTYGLSHDDGVLDAWLREGNALDDPPAYEWYRQHGGLLGLEPVPTWYVHHLVEVFQALRPSLKRSASLWINLGDTYFARWSSIREGRQGLGGGARARRRTPSGGVRHDKQLLLLPARFAIAMQEMGWILRNDLIWSKPHVAPRPERDRLRLSHEHFFHFVQRTPGGRPTYYYDLAGVEAGALDVVASGVRAGGSGHSAAFPAAIVEPRILSSSPRGGVVVDPFCGTGVALVIAAQHGRTALGADLNEGFANAARGRHDAIIRTKAA